MQGNVLQRIADGLRRGRITRNEPAPECTHDNCSGVDERPVSDLKKVWRCDHCGFYFRYITVPNKPWWIQDYERVEVVS